MDIPHKKAKTEAEEDPKTEVATLNEAVGSAKGLQTVDTTPLLEPDVLPLVIKYQQKQALLACRGVTQDGKRVIDQVIQNYWSSPLVAFEGNRKEHHSEIALLDGSYRFNSSDSVNRFLEMNGSRSLDDNPFITRKVDIEIEDFEAPDEPVPIFAEDYSSLRTLLFQFGHHIWRLKYVNLQSDEDSCQSLISFLHLTPNLKVLDLDLCDPFNDVGDLNPVFPPLDQLEWMIIDIFSGDFTDTLFRTYGSQLNALTCINSSLLSFKTNVTPYASLDPSLLSKLTKLRIQTSYPLTSAYLDVMTKLVWKIDVLEVNFLYDEGEQVDGMEELFPVDLLQAISNFGQELVRLELKIDFEEFDKDSEVDFNVFPLFSKLRKFELHLESTWMEKWLWEFIVATCKNLQAIKFVVANVEFEAKFQELAEEAFGRFDQLEKFSFIALENGKVSVKRVIRRASIFE